MKKILSIGLLLLTAFAFVSCGSKTTNNERTITVGATSVPHAEILKEAAKELEKENYTLNVKEFSDYSLLNIALQEGEIDANFFQHKPYLEEFVTNTGAQLVALGSGVHVEPMGIYSSRIATLEGVQDGAIVTIPKDPTNQARALMLLQEKGLITIKDGGSIKSVIADIEENPKNLQISEMDAANLPRTLGDVDLSVINTNYALQASLNPITDALALEDKASSFVNILVVRSGEEDQEKLQALNRALTSDNVRTFIETKYQGSIIPVF